MLKNVVEKRMNEKIILAEKRSSKNENFRIKSMTPLLKMNIYIIRN